MTGAGSASAAYTLENSFLGGVGSSPTYYLPGTNFTVDTMEIENFLVRVRDPGQRESIRSSSGRFEGALSVSFTFGNNDFHDLLFNDTDGAGNDTFGSGLVPSAEWYLGTDFLSSGSVNTAERVAKGWVCVQATINYSENDDITVTLDGVYGDESYDQTLTPGSISKPSTEVPFHSAEFAVGGTVQTKLQSATVTMSDLARFERGASRQPIDAVAGPANTTLDLQAIFSETDQLELAYGSSGSGSVQDSMSGVDGSLTLSPGGAAVAK